MTSAILRLGLLTLALASAILFLAPSAIPSSQASADDGCSVSSYQPASISGGLQAGAYIGCSPAAYRTFGVNLKEAVANKPDPDISCNDDVHTSSGHSHYASRAMTYDPDGNPQYYFSEGFVADAYSVDFPFHDPDSANVASDYETGARC